MKLSIVHYYPRAGVGDGGCSAAVRGWASAVGQTGAQVTIVSDGRGEPRPACHVQWRSVPHRGWGRMRAPVGLEHLVEGRDLLVLHSGWVFHNVKAARSAVRSRVPYVLTPHGAYDPNIFKRRKISKRLWWSIFEHQLVTDARAIHVFFEEQRDQLRQVGYTGPVLVVPNGVTVPDFEALPDRSSFLLWMGRFDIEIKGIDLLLQALSSLHPSQRPHARLHGPDWRGGKERAAKLVHVLQLQDYVTIGPPLYGSEKWHALRECGLFLFPSRWEGQGLMALEAAAAGAPLVVTNTTAVGRQLGAARAAVVVDATPQSIAAGIAESSSSERQERGYRASRLVKEKFGWPAVAENYLQQLVRVL